MNKIKKYKKKNYHACAVCHILDGYKQEDFFNWFYNMVIYYDQRTFELECKRDDNK